MAPKPKTPHGVSEARLNRCNDCGPAKRPSDALELESEDANQINLKCPRCELVHIVGKAAS